MKTKMKKIIVIGCPGSGKSTFARRLNEITSIPLYYLDMIWHKADKTNITQDEFDFKLNQIISKKEWIIDGNYQRTLNTRLENCDTVFLLNMDVDTCLLGAQSRIGKKRVDIPWVETEFDEEFKQYILNFNKEQLPEIYNKLSRINSKTIIIFNTHDEINSYLENLKKEYKK